MGGLDRRAEVQALVLRLLDQHDGLERADVVDALLLARRRDLGLIRPVVELHLRDPGDLAHLAEIELDLLEMLGEIDRLQKVDVSADCHRVLESSRVTVTPRLESYKGSTCAWEGHSAEISPFRGIILRRGRRASRRARRPTRRRARATRRARRRGAA